jgi:hypothetical protein
VRSVTKRQWLRLSGILFLLAAAAFWFGPARWMTAVEGSLGVLMLLLSLRVADEP